MTDVPSPQLAPVKLPFWATIGGAYAVWFRQFGALLRISWVWMLVLTPFLAVLTWFQVPYTMEIMQASQSGKGVLAPFSLQSFVLGILGQLVMLPALSSVAVGWHRMLLLDEHPAPGVYRRLDSVVTGYAGLALVLALMAFAPSYAVALLRAAAGLSTTGASAVIMIGGLASIVVMVLTARLSLALPAKAVGAEATLGWAWNITRGSNARLFFGHLFCILPWGLIVGLGGQRLYTSDLSRGALTAVTTVLGVSWVVFSMVSIGFLSLSYRHFARRQ